MATTTPNLGLTKPDYTDNADISVINNNMDLIDTAVQNMNIVMQQRVRVWNLLDNSNFLNPVNQRGASSVTTGWTYFIDRWEAPSASASAPISVSTNGLTMSNTAGTATMSLRQYIANFKDGTYTAAANANGVVYWRVFTVTNGALSNGANNFDGKGQIYLSISGSTLQYNLQAFKGHDVTCQWAALYEGEYTAETLPAYVPKGYAAELAECQRYFWRCNNTWLAEGCGYAFSDTLFHASIVLPQMMRVTPTMTSSTGDTTNYGIKINVSSGSRRTPTAITYELKNNRIAMKLTGTYTSGELGVLRLENSYLDFSADL